MFLKMKYSHTLSEPDLSYLELIDSLVQISNGYKKFNQNLIKDFAIKRRLDDKLLKVKKNSVEKNKISEEDFKTLFNKINFNFYPKEIDEECGKDELRKIKQIELSFSKQTIKNNRAKPKRISTSFVHLISEVLYHDDFVEQLLNEINAYENESESDINETDPLDIQICSKSFSKKTKYN